MARSDGILRQICRGRVQTAWRKWEWWKSLQNHLTKCQSVERLCQWVARGEGNALIGWVCKGMGWECNVIWWVCYVKLWEYLGGIGGGNFHDFSGKPQQREQAPAHQKRQFLFSDAQNKISHLTGSAMSFASKLKHWKRIAMSFSSHLSNTVMV